MTLTRITSFRIFPSGLPIILIFFIFLFKASFDGILEEEFSGFRRERHRLFTHQDHYLLHQVVLNWVEE